VIIIGSMERHEVISRVHRQHNSLVVVVPLAVRSVAGIQQGDYVYWSWRRDGRAIRFGKVVIGKGLEDGSGRHRVGEDRGR